MRMAEEKVLKDQLYLKVCRMSDLDVLLHDVGPASTVATAQYEDSWLLGGWQC
jgi:hypothetical protein